MRAAAGERREGDEESSNERKESRGEEGERREKEKRGTKGPSEREKAPQLLG